jgi:hypothetical protein
VLSAFASPVVASNSSSKVQAHRLPSGFGANASPEQAVGNAFGGLVDLTAVLTGADVAAVLRAWTRQARMRRRPFFRAGFRPARAHPRG